MLDVVYFAIEAGVLFMNTTVGALTILGNILAIRYFRKKKQ